MLLPEGGGPIEVRPDGDAGPVYLMRVPSRWARVEVERLADRKGAENPTEIQLLDALHLAAGRHLRGDELERARAVIAAHRALYVDAVQQLVARAITDVQFGERIKPGVELEQLQDLILSVDPDYREKSKASSYYGYLIGCAAAEILLTAVRVDGVEIAGFAPGASPEARERMLDRIPPAHLRELGRAFLRASRVPEAQVGNSASPPGGG